MHELRVRVGVPVRRGRSGRQVHELGGGGGGTSQARPVRPSCAGRAGCRSGEASQAITCWGAGCQAGHHVLGAGHQAGEAGQLVRPSFA